MPNKILVFTLRTFPTKYGRSRYILISYVILKKKLLCISYLHIIHQRAIKSSIIIIHNMCVLFEKTLM